MVPPTRCHSSYSCRQAAPSLVRHPAIRWWLLLLALITLSALAHGVSKSELWGLTSAFLYFAVFVLALDFGLHGARETLFDVCAVSGVGCSHYPGWRGYEAFRRRLCATGVRSSGTVRTCRGPSDADRGG